MAAAVTPPLKHTKVMSDVDRLDREFGGDPLAIDLPQLVVIGSQSSGKSTLIEGLIEVPIPRGNGTCTRCPIIFRVSRREDIPWRCNIWIGLEFGQDGEPLVVPERRRKFGSEISEPEQVHQRIRQAQAAVLHYPIVGPDEFLKPDAQLEGEGFTHNTISVEIDGPNVQSLSFLDLPGIIARNPEGQPGMVDRVKDLATKYVRKETSLILLVYHCSDDELNQGAAELAKKYDPDEQRTVVVLTKPDLLSGNANPEQNDPEAVEHWQRRVRGSANWFCVRQPGRGNPNLPWTEAREQERQFFEEDWQVLFNDPTTSNRLGTDNLRNYLATRLYEWIAERLPELQRKARLRLHQMEAELRSLPQPVDQPVSFMTNLLWEFNRKVEKAIDIDKFHNPPLLQVCRARLEEFDDTLVYYLHPRFRPFSREAGARDGVKDYQEEHATSAEIPQLKRNIQLPQPVYLEEVMARSKERGRELPGNYPYGVKKSLMETSVTVWQKETDDMLDDIAQRISVTLQDIISEHFGSYQNGELADLVSGTVKTHIQSLYSQARGELLAIQEREMVNSGILGCAEFHAFYKIYLEHYLAGFQFLEDGSESRGSETNPLEHPLFDHYIDIAAKLNPTFRIMAEAFKEFTKSKSGAKEAKSKWFTKRQATPVDVEKWAVEVMASTRAFYHIAVRRYAGGAEQLVLYDLLLNLCRRRTLVEKIEKEIGFGESDLGERCAHYVERSKEVTKKYNEVRRRVTVLPGFLLDIASPS